MAGEILTGGLNTKVVGVEKEWDTGDYLYTSGHFFHGIGAIDFTFALPFKLGTSNKANIRIYRKLFGEQANTLFYTKDFDSTSGTNDGITITGIPFAWYSIEARAIFNVVDFCSASLIVIARTEPSSVTKDKKLRICNNQFLQDSALSIVPYSEITTSVGTLMQNGQWIFGQN